MEKANNEIQDLKGVFIDFVSEQRKFNDEQRKFNDEQRKFNFQIDKKIDKVQYFLEEQMAETSKMFFEEQIEMKGLIKDMETEIDFLKNEIMQITSEIKYLKLKVI